MISSLEVPKEMVYDLPVTLIGFSKGCVVLNQLVHEMGNYLNENSDSKIDDKKMESFLKQIKCIYWLDSGHSGERECWITDTELLKYLVQLKVDIFVHVSPHQMKCTQRPWISEEEREFVDYLRQMGIDVKETHHFSDQPRSLLNHFKILKRF